MPAYLQIPLLFCKCSSDISKPRMSSKTCNLKMIITLHY